MNQLELEKVSASLGVINLAYQQGRIKKAKYLEYIGKYNVIRNATRGTDGQVLKSKIKINNSLSVLDNAIMLATQIQKSKATAQKAASNPVLQKLNGLMTSIKQMVKK